MVAYSVLLPVRHTDWGLRDYGTAKWKGGDPECKHNPQRPDGGERSDRTLPLGRGGLYRDICGKCGATRIDNQLGLERTPEEYIANMVGVFRECWRVLRDDGTCWIDIGDSYASSGLKGSGRTNNAYADKLKIKGSENYKAFTPQKFDFGVKPKDLVGIPWRLAFALQADGWYLRSDIIWSKPNPMPESVTDRPTKSHEYLFLLAKQERYYYDAEAIREPVQDVTLERLSQDNFDNQKGGDKDPKSGNRSERRTLENLKERYSKQGVWEDRFTGYELWKEKGIGRNRRTVWTIPTAPYKGAHFATFPPALVEPCIKAGTSERGACPKCGKGWRRVVEKEQVNKSGWGKQGKSADDVKDNGKYGGEPKDGSEYYDRKRKDYDIRLGPTINTTTVDWRPACTCDAGNPIPCLVFDPFVGSGTTVKVAYDLGRRGVGLDLSLDYLDEQARKRIHNGHIARLF